MRTKFLLVLVLLAGIADPGYSGELRDGSWWNHLTYGQKESWAVGWMDGLCAGERIVGGVIGDPAYHAAILKLNGMESDQLIQGMDQFYAADYRNLVVVMQDAALLVAMYARGLTSEQARRTATAMRERGRAAQVAP